MELLSYETGVIVMVCIAALTIGLRKFFKATK
jgi:hypothetical protein